MIYFPLRLLDSSFHLRQVFTKENSAGTDEKTKESHRPMAAVSNNQTETNGSAPGSGAMLQRFAETAEAVAATTKKLEKAAILGNYFQELDNRDLSRAARYFA